MPDRYVKTTLIIDEHGAVRAVKGVGDESGHTERKLGQLDKSVRGLGKSFGGLKGMIAGGLGALGAGGLVFGLSSIANKTKEVALETEEFHTQTGIATSSSLYYAHALKARGLTTEQVGKAFGILSKNVKTAELQEKSRTAGMVKGTLGEEKRQLALKRAEEGGKKYAVMQAKLAIVASKGTSQVGRQAEAFRELGIDLRTFGQLSEQGKLEEVTKHFEAMAPGMKKTRLERELFGRGGNQLSIVLEKGNLGLTHQLALVKKYFPTIKDGSHAMEELLEKQTESKLAWEGLEFTIGQKLVPAMTTVMSTMSEVAIEIEKGKGIWGELEHTFEGIGKFAGSAFGFIKKIGDALGVKLTGNTLGAVLAAAAGVKVAKVAAKPVGTAAKGAKFAGKAVKWGGPAAVPFAAGAAIPFGTAVGIHAGVEALSPGYLKEQSVADYERRLFGNAPLGGGRSLAGWAARGGGETKAEAALVSRLIAGMKPTDPAHIHLYLDTVKVAEAQLHNPKASRILAEAVVRYSQGMTARK